MQTFLPFPSFTETAKVLDRQRLGKQRVETLQILQTLNKGESAEKGKRSWYSHPATQMWKGYENALAVYGVETCKEWIYRGYKDTCLPKIKSFITGSIILPSWLGMSKFHAAHRGILLDKNYEWYRRFNWSDIRLSKIENSYPYVWPTKELKCSLTT